MILYKTIDICTKSCYFVDMNKIVENDIGKEQAVKKVCDFFRLDSHTTAEIYAGDIIKELCVARLCKAIGLAYKDNFKSEFFNFFSCIMGEAVCQKLGLNIRIASDELRLVKYDNVNLVKEVKSYLDNETVEEAFLDAFNLVDNFKYLIPMLKKV